MSTELAVKDVIDFPVPVSKENPKGIIEIDIEVDGKNIKLDDKWIIPHYQKVTLGKLGQYTAKE